MDSMALKLPSFNSQLLSAAAAAARGPSSIRFGFHGLSSMPFSSSSSPVLAAVNKEAETALGSLSLGQLTRPDFPLLHQEVNGSKLVYLDNAATSQKPNSVLKALQNYYESYNSNVHRGIHYLSAKATDEYELARKKVAAFINAFESREIVFTRNATEAINLVFLVGLTYNC